MTDPANMNPSAGRIAKIFFALAAAAALALFIVLVPRYLREITRNSAEGPGVERIGTDVLLSRFAGSPMAVLFWTAWQADAVEQFEEFSRAAGTSDAGTFVAVLMDSTGSTSSPQASSPQAGDNMHVLFDADGDAADRFGIGVVPVTVFINKKGVEVYRVVGPMTADEIHKYIKTLEH